MSRLTKALEAVRQNLAQADGCRECDDEGWLPHDEHHTLLHNCPQCNLQGKAQPPQGFKRDDEQSKPCCNIFIAAYDFHADDIAFDTWRERQ